MSHELRTPLNHIIGFTDLALDAQVGELNETQREFLTDVAGSGRHLLSLINDILDLAKVEAGRIHLNPGPVRLKELLESSLLLVKEKALQHRITVNLATDGVPDTIAADERKLKQMPYNLLSNACKFTPDGGDIRLSVEKIIETGEESELVAKLKITVADNGIGLHSEDLERIFTPFEQLDNSASRMYAGTGLGLSLT
jgi:signal transduction histidine kinase